MLHTSSCSFLASLLFCCPSSLVLGCQWHSVVLAELLGLTRSSLSVHSKQCGRAGTSQGLGDRCTEHNHCWLLLGADRWRSEVPSPALTRRSLFSRRFTPLGQNFPRPSAPAFCHPLASSRGPRGVCGPWLSGQALCLPGKEFCSGEEPCPAPGVVPVAPEDFRHC